MAKEININDLGTVLLDQMKTAGWSVEIDADYPDDFKEYYATSSTSSESLFSCLTVLLITLDNNPNNYDIRFIYYANPAQIKISKRKFASILRALHVPKLQAMAEIILRNCNVTALREEMTIESRKKYRLKLDSGPPVSPAYAVQFHYWKQPCGHVPQYCNMPRTRYR